MSREQAIARILDEGADLTEDNISAELKKMDKAIPKPDPRQDVLQELKGVRGAINQLIEEVKRGREIKIPEIKVPAIIVPQANITIPEGPRKKRVYEFVRDLNGNIIKATSTEE